MKPWSLPSDRQRSIPFVLPDDWTPEQALAIVEFLNDLREIIWDHYEIPLHELAYFAERDRSFRVIVTGGEMLHG